MATIRPDNYAALLTAFAAQPKGRPNFALAARTAGVDQRTAKRIYQKGLSMHADRAAMPPIEVALAKLAAGRDSAPVVADSMIVLQNSSAALLESSAPFIRAIAAVAPSLEAKLQALPVKEAAALFTEFSRSLARVVDSTEKIRALEKAIAWQVGAPAREAAEIVAKESERQRIAALPADSFERQQADLAASLGWG
jgi:hypothetical protein